MTTFAVITRVPSPEDGGNMAFAMDVRVDPQARGGMPGDPMLTLSDVGLPPLLAIYLRAPVFLLGEIVLLDEPHGREIVGHGRKPSKWDVDVEHFDTIDAAIERAQAVSA